VADYVAALARGERPGGNSGTAGEEGAAGAQAGSSGGETGSTPTGGGAQFVVVSHKPQVFERARCLLGVYAAAGGGAEAVVARCF
jgi:hypothetical protein